MANSSIRWVTGEDKVIALMVNEKWKPFFKNHIERHIPHFSKKAKSATLKLGTSNDISKLRSAYKYYIKAAENAGPSSHKKWVKTVLHEEFEAYCDTLVEEFGAWELGIDYDLAEVHNI